MTFLFSLFEKNQNFDIVNNELNSIKNFIEFSNEKHGGKDCYTIFDIQRGSIFQKNTGDIYYSVIGDDKLLIYDFNTKKEVEKIDLDDLEIKVLKDNTNTQILDYFFSDTSLDLSNRIQEIRIKPNFDNIKNDIEEFYEIKSIPVGRGGEIREQESTKTLDTKLLVYNPKEKTIFAPNSFYSESLALSNLCAIKGIIQNHEIKIEELRENTFEKFEASENDDKIVLLAEERRTGEGINECFLKEECHITYFENGIFTKAVDKIQKNDEGKFTFYSFKIDELKMEDIKSTYEDKIYFTTYKKVINLIDPYQDLDFEEKDIYVLEIKEESDLNSLFKIDKLFIEKETYEKWEE